MSETRELQDLSELIGKKCLVDIDGWHPDDNPNHVDILFDAIITGIRYELEETFPYGLNIYVTVKPLEPIEDEEQYTLQGVHIDFISHIDQ